LLRLKNRQSRREAPGFIPNEQRIILETSVGRGKGMEDIGVRGESEKFVVTLLVMRDFSGLPGTPRACVDFRDPTEASRIMPRGDI
jgi:hypothetical protein